MAVSNILDPISDKLDPAVWENPLDPEPRLKPQLLHWIKNAVKQALEDHGYEHTEDWTRLCLTGSLTTYQYAPDSDCDVSLFVDTVKFPEWSRGEMIGIMISEFDGSKNLPGTGHPLQVYVVPKDLKPEDLYQHGLRSAYSLDTDRWIVPPERGRAHDVQKEYKAAFAEALEDADKMELLIEFEPDKAVQYYRQIHRRRMSDQTRGKGDFSDANIVYKFLDRRGLFQQVAQIGGFKLAASPYVPRIVRKFVYDDQTGLHVTEYGREEGEVPSHNQLGRAVGIEDPALDPNVVLGTISQSGWVQFEGGSGDAKVRYRAQQALRDKYPDLQGFIGGDVSDYVGTGGGQWSFARAKLAT